MNYYTRKWQHTPEFHCIFDGYKIHFPGRVVVKSLLGGTFKKILPYMPGMRKDVHKKLNSWANDDSEANFYFQINISASRKTTSL